MQYARDQTIIIDGFTYSVQVPKDKNLAGVFALLLGGLGIHHFYNRQPGWGILYLLFSWTFIPSIVAFFEAFWFWFTTEETFYKYHRHLLGARSTVPQGWNPAPAPTSAPSSWAARPAEAGAVQRELYDWKRMLDRGVITQDEFDRKKAELLDLS